MKNRFVLYSTSNTQGLRPSPRIGNNGHYYSLVCPLQECLISREDGKGKARDSFKVKDPRLSTDEIINYLELRLTSIPFSGKSKQ